MRWRILALLFAARIALGIQFQTMASVGDKVGLVFGMDYTEIGMLIGLFMLPGIFIAFPAGLLGRFVSDRILVVSGLAALAAGGVVTSIGSDFAVIGVGRLLAGLGFIFASLYFNKMVADWFEGREIATAMSILVMSWPLGIAIGQVGHVWLADTLAWQAPFQFTSAYCAMAAICVAVMYRAPNDLPPLATAGSMSLLPREWQLTIAAGLAWGLFNAAYVVYLTFGPLKLVELGHTNIGASSMASIASWLMVLSGALCGQIADRFGGRNVMLGICMAAAVPGFYLLTIPGGELAASPFFGLVIVAPAGVIMSLAGEAVARERRAFGMGVFFTIYYVITMAGPPVSGAILDATGSLNATLSFGAFLFLLVLPSVALFHFSKHTCRQSLAQGRKT